MTKRSKIITSITVLVLTVTAFTAVSAYASKGSDILSFTKKSSSINSKVEKEDKQESSESSSVSSSIISSVSSSSVVSSVVSSVAPVVVAPVSSAKAISSVPVVDPDVEFYNQVVGILKANGNYVATPLSNKLGVNFYLKSPRSGTLSYLTASKPATWQLDNVNRTHQQVLDYINYKAK